MLSPITRGLAQLNDPAFLAVMGWSLVCAGLLFVVLHFAAIWVVHAMLALRGWQAWLGDILGTVGVWLLGLWLFLPCAALIATLFLDRIAAAVERRYYPTLLPAPGCSVLAVVLDGLALAWRVLLLGLLALILAMVIPGIGLVLAWAIGAYAVGRGFFMAVAMRRFPRRQAERIYVVYRGVVLAQGGILALASYVPGVNLLVPVVGTAAMVHVLDTIMQHDVTAM